jgi:putative PIN family toxin of toxin-antitoxin system
MMIRVVLDANIFVSTVLKSHSKPAKVFQLAKEGKVTLISSKDILSEVKAVLLYPKLRKFHHRTPKEIDAFVKKATRVSFIVPGTTKIQEIKDDPADNKYLSAAVEGRADFVISGDHHLKDLKTFQGIRIIDPSSFLTLITKS